MNEYPIDFDLSKEIDDQYYEKKRTKVTSRIIQTFKMKWCDILMDKIEEIAKEKYPDVPYWIDTGSRLNCCMAMLEQFKRDIK